MSQISPTYLAVIPRLVNAAAGVWLMAMPGILGYAGTTAAASDRIVGPFIVCFSVVAIWEVTRGARRANFPFAAWACIGPFVLPGYPMAGMIGSVAAGALVLALSFCGGHTQQRFGGGWPTLWKKTPEGELLTNEKGTN